MSSYATKTMVGLSVMGGTWNAVIVQCDIRNKK